MFDKIGKEIDAVMIATPDHARFAIAMAAIRRGKHVYAEKPLCHTVNEVRLLTEEAAKNPKIVTQMGNQGHSTCQRRADQRLGGSRGDRPGPGGARLLARRTTGPTSRSIEGSTIPDTLDWNLYLNRAGEVPFSESYMNREWIRYRHFSGSVGDMGGHTLDAGYYALGLTAPISVRAEVPVPATPWSMPRAGVITWEFPARGDKPPVTMKYYLGTDIEFPRPKHLDPDRKDDRGRFLPGRRARIDPGRQPQPGRAAHLPRRCGRPRRRRPPPPSAARPATTPPTGLWPARARTRRCRPSTTRARSPRSSSSATSPCCIPGATLNWDAAKMEITNHEAANKSLFMRRISPRDQLNWY